MPPATWVRRAPLDARAPGGRRGVRGGEAGETSEAAGGERCHTGPALAIDQGTSGTKALTVCSERGAIGTGSTASTPAICPAASPWTPARAGPPSTQACTPRAPAAVAVGEWLAGAEWPDDDFGSPGGTVTGP
ncbi:hypothetical protein AB5J49_42255 [Streptomyces sp. R28]|uniref:Carbohydrate kinase FGGY N-terminal domain-containing protein n=1 Tax=Streptomyces sp. R28 TaxID=3238628 RepID=A0AB39QBY1_9ACTN